MANFSNATIGVTGAGGHLGRAVIGYLRARGAKRIVGVTRDPAKLAPVEGVEVRAGDFGDPASLAAAFEGIGRLLVISTDRIAERIDGHVAAIDAAERAGVAHVIYTSIASPYPHHAHLVFNDHFWTEARLFAFGGGWTALRDNLYGDFLVTEARRALDSGKLIHAAGNGRRALVARDDIAATAAGVLLAAEGREIVDVSGPEALSYAEIAAILSRLAGRPVEAVAVSEEAQIAALVAAGVPQAMAGAIAGFDAAAARGLLAIRGDGVRRFAGREPKSIEAILAEGLAGPGA